MTDKLWYFQTAQDLTDLLVSLGNPKGLACLVAEKFMAEHDLGTAFYWDQLKEEIAKAARAVVSEVIDHGVKQGKFQIGIDEDGDFAIMVARDSF